jgi:hypothetical protein
LHLSQWKRRHFAACVRGKPPGVPGAANGAGYSGSAQKGQELWPG